jgi:glycosyltransferase involved in cell wall biosynthesis
MPALPLTIVIPTFGRERVLIDTIEALRRLPDRAAEVIVVDQTFVHEPSTKAALKRLSDSGGIVWMRLAHPSIPAAMNAGLIAASQPIVLFLDDDIAPEPGLVSAHHEAHVAHAQAIVAGRVLQPWDEGKESSRSDAPFAGIRPQWVREFMGGNFSLPRDLALAAGGFDENFVRVAYRFEAEFAHRWQASGHRIRFEPAACIHHLKVASGGTRSFGEHLTTWRPDHAVGAYYWSLRTRSWREFFARPLRSVATRFHLRHPWRIPATVFAELGGMLWAIGLYFRGPRRIPQRSRTP